MDSFCSDNIAYEAWLRTQCDVVNADLDYKHARMKKSAFVFLRATFFRWAKCIEHICPELKETRKVLSVGDTHVENFGTWRDLEGRLVWGVNDFDEAATIPYPFDLVRLAASVQLSGKIAVGKRDAASAILEGYSAGLKDPRPMLLDEHELWMRRYVSCTSKARQSFWDEVDKYPDIQPPETVTRDLLASVPEGAKLMRFATRVKGGGSLGRPRFVVITSWRGGRIVREAKSLVPSAWYWATGAPGFIHFLDLARGAYRAPDPWLEVRNGYVLRRIAADARKIELGDVVGAKLTVRLLKAMGADVGSIHAATPGAAEDILVDLRDRSIGWLHASAKAAVEAVKDDYADWAR